MRKFLPLVLFAATVAGPGSALGQGRAELRDIIATFVAEEVEDAGAARQEAITDCLLAAFDGVSDAELQVFLAEEDFEDSLDALVKAYPEREEALEVCEDL